MAPGRSPIARRAAGQAEGGRGEAGVGPADDVVPAGRRGMVPGRLGGVGQRQLRRQLAGKVPVHDLEASAGARRCPSRPAPPARGTTAPASRAMAGPGHRGLQRVEHGGRLVEAPQLDERTGPPTGRSRRWGGVRPRGPRATPSGPMAPSDDTRLAPRVVGARRAGWAGPASRAASAPVAPRR